MDMVMTTLLVDVHSIHNIANNKNTYNENKNSNDIWWLVLGPGDFLFNTPSTKITNPAKTTSSDIVVSYALYCHIF